MLNYGFTFQPISASNRNRLHSVSATMILRGPRLDQGQRLLSYRTVSKDWPFCQSTSLRDAMQSPGILVTNQEVITWNCLSNMDFYGNYSSPCIKFLQLNWYCFFSFTVILTHMNYISFDVLYVLPSVKFKDSYYVVAVDNYFFRWGFSVYYAFHDQPEEDLWSFRLLLLKSW